MPETSVRLRPKSVFGINRNPDTAELTLVRVRWLVEEREINAGLY
jgi:hypothetical protein